MMMNLRWKILLAHLFLSSPFTIKANVPFFFPVSDWKKGWRRPGLKNLNPESYHPHCFLNPEWNWMFPRVWRWKSVVSVCCCVWAGVFVSCVWCGAVWKPIPARQTSNFVISFIRIRKKGHESHTLHHEVLEMETNYTITTSRAQGHSRTNLNFNYSAK